MNIVLIGYRGTGKSCVAAILARRLGRDVISTDAEVVRRAGASIPEIVEAHGWEHFRTLEADVCRDVAARRSVIIDTGGGAILRRENVEALKADGLLFWLTAEVPTIAKRISGDTQRPALTADKSFVDEVQQVLTERMPAYRSAADHVLATDDLTPNQLADAIVAIVGPRGADGDRASTNQGQ